MTQWLYNLFAPPSGLFGWLALGGFLYFKIKNVEEHNFACQLRNFKVFGLWSSIVEGKHHIFNLPVIVACYCIRQQGYCFASIHEILQDTEKNKNILTL